MGLIRVGTSVAKAAIGNPKHWIRVGASYSKTTGLKTVAVRWGTNNHYRKEIGSEALRTFNDFIHNSKIPVNSWGALDAGHFHLLVK